ncbi:hypothetical protein D3C81_1535550 [compost metagenome]
MQPTTDEQALSLEPDLADTPYLEHQVAWFVFDLRQLLRVAAQTRLVARDGRLLVQRFVRTQLVVLLAPARHHPLAVFQIVERAL